MKSKLAVGLLGYGAYVPRLRLRTQSIARIWRAPGSAAPAVAEKSVPSLDEDVITMSIEAARTAVDRAEIAPDPIGAVWVGTESKTNPPNPIPGSLNPKTPPLNPPHTLTP